MHCLVSNALFRMGGAACLMTSGNAQRRLAKYELLDAERVNQAARDESFNSMFVGPDEAGLDGIFLYKSLPAEAGRALTSALTKITPRILDWPQFLSAAVTTLKRKYYGKEKVPRFVPDYTKCVDHFLLHAGGYGVLKGIQAGMNLPAEAMMPSFANLSQFGNTSSATTWYSWTYLESTTGVKKGERILQAGVGGGMKAAVVLWKAVRDVRAPHRAWAHLAGVPYTEADLPRPITVTGTLTGLDEDGRPVVAAAKGKGKGRGGGDKAAKEEEGASAAAAKPAADSTAAAQQHPESPKTPGRVVT
jgi:3-ketoacyl-CoA synthase